MLVNFIYFLSDLNKTSVIFLYGFCLLPKEAEKQYLDEKVVSLLFCFVFLLCMRVTRNFLGQRSFLGILALRYTLTYSTRKLSLGSS